MKTNPLDDAFPSHHPDGNYSEAGLTKREHMATQIMAGLAAHSGAPSTPKSAADVAVKWADALIQALNGEQCSASESPPSKVSAA